MSLRPHGVPDVASRPGDDTVVLLDQVTVTRGGNDLLAELSWSVELDERWVVLGPNGAGKTTLLQLISAQLHPTRGTVRLLGEELGSVDVFELRPRIGLSTVALASRIPEHEQVVDLVVSAAYAVLGRWRESYDETDLHRARELLGQLGVAALAERGPSARCPRASASGSRSPAP